MKHITYNDVEPQIQRMTKDIFDLMNQIKSFADKDSRYPKTSTIYDIVHTSLNNLSSDVVVCGEVKRGKSTLLNAIIGDDILPVNSDIATSQVFRVSRNTHKSYYQVYTDGARKSIKRYQLSRYGAMPESEEVKLLKKNGHILSHIQIDIPQIYPIGNISFIDTPGFGSIHKSNEWLIQNYLKKASAILFILDVFSPIDKAELTYINNILDITPNIVYAICKIDMVNYNDYSIIRSRVEDVLSKIHADRGLQAPVICPVSGKLLRDAELEDDAEFKSELLKVSHYSQLHDALVNLIQLEKPLRSIKTAIYESKIHLAKTKSTISDLLTASKVEIEGQTLNISVTLDTIQNLQETWSWDSPLLKELSRDISTIIQNTKKKVKRIFAPKSAIFKHYRGIINDAKTYEQIHSLCDALPASVINEIAQLWSSILSETTVEVDAYVNSILSKIDSCITANDSIGSILDNMEFSDLRRVLGYCHVPFPDHSPAIIGCYYLSAWMFKNEQNIQELKRQMKANLDDLRERLKNCILGSEEESSNSLLNTLISDIQNYEKDKINDTFSDTIQHLYQHIDALEEQHNENETIKLIEQKQFNKDLEEIDTLFIKCDKLLDDIVDIES